MAQTQETPDAQLGIVNKGVTVQAVAVGLFLVVILDMVATYVRYYYHGSRMTLSHVPMAMLMVFVVMILGLAVIARYTRFVLSSGEWHTILAMGIVGATLPASSSVGFLIGRIAAPY